MLLSILGDLACQFLVLFAPRAADLFKRGEVFVRLRKIISQQIRFADVLVRAAVLGIDFQRALVVVKRFVEVADMAVGIAEIGMDVGVDPYLVKKNPASRAGFVVCAAKLTFDTNAVRSIS